jgi:hypothetical protein
VAALGPRSIEAVAVERVRPAVADEVAEVVAEAAVAEAAVAGAES